MKAQTQEDFNAKLSDVYANASDKKKALTIAKDMYDMVEKKWTSAALQLPRT